MKLDIPPKYHPSWMGKENNQLTLKEALEKIKHIEREQAMCEKLVSKAARLLEDYLP